MWRHPIFFGAKSKPASFQFAARVPASASATQDSVLVSSGECASSLPALPQHLCCIAQCPIVTVSREIEILGIGRDAISTALRAQTFLHPRGPACPRPRRAANQPFHKPSEYRCHVSAVRRTAQHYGIGRLNLAQDRLHVVLLPTPAAFLFRRLGRWRQFLQNSICCPVDRVCCCALSWAPARIASTAASMVLVLRFLPCDSCPQSPQHYCASRTSGPSRAQFRPKQRAGR
jgi:hypothetical protein